MRPTAFHKVKHPSLVEAVKPLRNLTYLFGVLPNWSSENEPNLLTVVASFIGIFLNLALTSLLLAYQVFQLIMEVKKSSSIHQIIMILLWICIYATGLSFHLYCLKKRTSLMSYIDDWSIVEQHPAIRKHLGFFQSEHTFTYRLLYGVYIVTEIVSIAGILTSVVFQPDQIFLLSHHRIFTEMLTSPVICFIHVETFFIFVIISALAQMFPTFVYHHGVLAISSLEQHVRHYFKFEVSIRPIKSSQVGNLFADQTIFEEQLKLAWTQMEKIRGFVGRANQIFGPLILIHHGCIFILACCLTYTVLRSINTSPASELFKLILIALVNVAHLIVPVLVMDRLSRSCRQFQASLSELFSENWFLLSENERSIVSTFLNRAQSTYMSVSPSDLYGVNRSLLLSMLSLTVTYIVILFQSK
jgi:7tm Chemosensory receptor